MRIGRPSWTTIFRSPPARREYRLLGTVPLLSDGPHLPDSFAPLARATPVSLSSISLEAAAEAMLPLVRANWLFSHSANGLLLRTAP
jgi:hypothetical protein